MTVDRIFVDGNTAIVQATTVFPHLSDDAQVNEVCAVLTFEGERIAVDETYMDLRHWPPPKFSGCEWARLLS